MRSCLVVLAVLVLVAQCAAVDGDSREAQPMSDLLLNGIRLSLDTPEALPLSAVLRGTPKYDAPRTFFTVSLKNESGKKRVLPFDELRRSTVRVYRNPATGAEIVDNRTPPPKRDGSVDEIAPGATRTFQVVFEYPKSIAVMKERVAVLQFCVKWDATWLRANTYTPGSYDWNESFEICRQIRILDE